MKIFPLFLILFFLNHCALPKAPSFQGVSTTLPQGRQDESLPAQETASTPTTAPTRSGNPVPESTSPVPPSESEASESQPQPQNTTESIVGTVVLNEILYDAAGSDTDGNEFIELYGTPGLSIEAYQIILVNGADGEITDTITLTQGARINSEGIYLIVDARTNSTSASNISGFDFIDNFDPQNGPDSIQLLSRDGELLDALAYGEGVMEQATNGLATGEGAASIRVESGHSLSRQEGQDSQDNSVDFIELETPSPGQV